MRINKFLALATGMSRRSADKAVAEGRVEVNGSLVSMGQDITESDQVTIDGRVINITALPTTLILNKPVGYVCSRNGQGSPTIYSLLPKNTHHLKPVGRLDKDSCGLLLLTNDGQLAYRLTHPKFIKKKIYEVELNKPLSVPDENRIKLGVRVDDYTSVMGLRRPESSKEDSRENLIVTLTQGKNRQIRRTFAALGYRVMSLRRISFAEYSIDGLKSGQFRIV